jgi:hypothetical protein
VNGFTVPAFIGAAGMTQAAPESVTIASDSSTACDEIRGMGIIRVNALHAKKG